jgi:hypothetical protein
MLDVNARCNGGYIELPFGYYAFCSQPHKIFNYLDQGSEAACQKWAVNYFEEKAGNLNLDYKKVIDYHDEVLIESSEDDADKVGSIMSEAYTLAAYEMWQWHKNNSKWFKDLTSVAKASASTNSNSTSSSSGSSSSSIRFT